MISDSIKNRMSQFIAERLEASKLLEIIETDKNHILISEKRIWAEHPRRAFIFAHHTKLPLAEVKEQWRRNQKQGVYTAHVFLKDGETFGVKLGKRAYLKAQKSLKKMSAKSLKTIILLRGLEKEVVQQFKNLAYYIPENDMRQECLALYDMMPVELDYSHLTELDNGFGFARNKMARDYKLPYPLWSVDRNLLAKVTFDESSLKRAIVLHAGYNVPLKDIFR